MDNYFILKQWFATSILGPALLLIYTDIRHGFNISDISFGVSYVVYKFISSRDLNKATIKLALLGVSILGIYITLQAMGHNALSRRLLNAYSFAAILSIVFIKINAETKNKS